ncbi:MAG: ATP-binding protein [Myxococcota bacterium]
MAPQTRPRKDPRDAVWVKLASRVLGPAVQGLIDPLGLGLLVVVGRRAWANGRAHELLGVPPRRDWTLVDLLREVHGEARVDEQVAFYERDRALHWPVTPIVPIRHRDGQLRSLVFAPVRRGPFEVTVLADVTEASRWGEHFHILFEASTAPHLIFDDRGILECNDAAVKILGLRDKVELLHRHPAEFSPERQPDGQLSSEKSAVMDRLAREREGHRFFWMHRTSQGDELPMEVFLRVVELPSGPAHLVVWTDLRDRLERERDLLAATRAAEEALAARQTFLASISHELRTPMNGVLGLVDAVLDDDALGQENRSTLGIVRASGRQLRQLLNDLLDFSKYEAGELELELRPTNLEGLADEVLALHAGNARVSLRRDVAPGLAPAFLADATRLRQVLSNLVSNAAKFTHEGFVVLRVSPGAEGGVVLEVEDTGIGMNEAQRARIFEPFRQADAGTTRRFGGTGLGLAIVDQLVEAMGGSVAVESTPGKGTTFRLELPLEPVDAVAEASLRVSPAPVADAQIALSVLVAEDNRVNRLVLEKTLAGLFPSVRMRFVEDGSLVAGAVAKETPDLVLMDVHMPVMDGLEATRQLRGSGHTGPILALTASAVDAERRACLDSGMNEVLTKPIDRDALRRVLREVWLAASASRVA